jgi:hypothetical protein
MPVWQGSLEHIDFRSDRMRHPRAAAQSGERYEQTKYLGWWFYRNIEIISSSFASNRGHLFITLPLIIYFGKSDKIRLG